MVGRISRLRRSLLKTKDVFPLGVVDGLEVLEDLLAERRGIHQYVPPAKGGRLVAPLSAKLVAVHW